MASIMQIINIDKNYKENVIDLTLYDTDFASKVQKLIYDDYADLENAISYLDRSDTKTHYKVSVQLISDTYGRQTQVKSNLEYYIESILRFFMPKNAVYVPPTRTFQVITANINTDADVLLLEKIVNNELYLEELYSTIDNLAKTYLKDFDFCIPETNVIYNDPKYYIPSEYLEWVPPSYPEHIEPATDDIIDIQRFVMYNIQLGYRTDFFQDKIYGKENFMSESAFLPFVDSKIGTVIENFVVDDRNQHTLDNFRNTDKMTQQLLENIKYRQDKINQSLSNYCDAIKSFADSKGIIIFLKNNATTKEIFSDEYNSLLNAEIQAEETFSKELARKIDLNTVNFKVRIYRIREVLDRIRKVLIEDTGYFFSELNFAGTTWYYYSGFEAPGTISAPSDNNVYGVSTLFSEQFLVQTGSSGYKDEGIYIENIDGHSVWHLMFFTSISSNVRGYIEYMRNSISATFPSQQYWKVNKINFTRLSAEKKLQLSQIPTNELTLKNFTDLI